MLSRPARWRLAFLALLATMLLVAMPTVTQVRAASGARADATHAAMAGMRHEAAPAGRDHHDDHDGACAYCPVLGGLLHWHAAPVVFMPPGGAGRGSTVQEQSPRAPAQPGTLGSRGPPARIAA
jgi:hypothetical protein